MSGLVTWIAISLALAAAGAVAFYVMRGGLGPLGGATFFKQRGEPRLAVIEHANMDGRRKLVLIRRDDVEHLIMTGGPVDVVIETGIGGQPAQAGLQDLPAAATVMTRSARQPLPPELGPRPPAFSARTTPPAGEFEPALSATKIENQ